MATEIKMPQLSDTMNAGKILSWKKKEGDPVARGDILAEVETEKANLEIECFTPGILLKIVLAAGSTAKVGEVIAVIGQAGESVSAVTQSASAAPTQPAPAEKPTNVPVMETQSQPQAAPAPAPAQTATPAPAPEPKPTGEERVKISPLAKKLAEERNVDIASLAGTGPGGRIVKKDVETAGAAARAPQAAPSPAEPRPTGEGRFIQPGKMREIIAQRMQESVTQSPHFFVTVSVDMEQVSKLKDTLKAVPEYKGISLNHLVIKAAAWALTREKGVNNAMREGKIYEPAQVNIGIITAVEDGLLIPVVKDADRLALKDVVFEAKAAVDRARAGRPNSSDLSGGTFSISNMGMMDVENFTAIINPGQGAVLAVSSALQEAVVKNGTVLPGLRMKATLSSDHRVIDGLMAAKFMGFFKQALENPALMLL